MSPRSRIAPSAECHVNDRGMTTGSRLAQRSRREPVEGARRPRHAFQTSCDPGAPVRSTRSRVLVGLGQRVGLVLRQDSRIRNAACARSFADLRASGPLRRRSATISLWIAWSGFLQVSSSVGEGAAAVPTRVPPPTEDVEGFRSARRPRPRRQEICRHRICGRLAARRQAGLAAPCRPAN